MAKKAALPTITKKKFETIEPQLRAELKAWWDEESENFDAAVAGTASVWDGMPEIDSKAVVKASPIIRKFTGADLDPKLIKKGGYASFDELVNDLFPKLKEACPPTSPKRRAPAASTMESINVRKS
jgi:hypothetical protein